MKRSLFAALLSVVITAGGLFSFHRHRVHEAGSLRYENDRLRREALQRNATRVAAMQAQNSDPVAADGVRVSPVAAFPTGPAKPVEYYRNEGQRTPLATLQTFAWACDRGDTELVGKLLYIDAATRGKAEAFMATLPASARAQWKTVDEMAAALLTSQGMNQPFPNADILATATPEPISEDRVRLRLPNVPKDGTEYQKTADGWKYVVTEKMVDAYIARSKAEPQAAQRK